MHRLLKHSDFDYHPSLLLPQTHAYPADELMPLSCKGRIRGKTKSRGDIDDALGRHDSRTRWVWRAYRWIGDYNLQSIRTKYLRFSLTLVDSLDTLAVRLTPRSFSRLALSPLDFSTSVFFSVPLSGIKKVLVFTYYLKLMGKTAQFIGAVKMVVRDVEVAYILHSCYSA